MMEVSWHNLIVYSAQVLVVVLAATIGARVLPLSVARGRLVFWRLVILVCLGLPFLPARRVEVVTPAPASLVTTAVIMNGTAELGAPSSSTTPLPRLVNVVPWLLLVGAGARLAWLALGLTRLRSLRTRSAPATLDAAIDTLKGALAPRAELRWSADIAQPVTFGLWLPVVLLPPRLGDLPPDAQRAVVCHELLHVARHDWIWTIGEELVRTALWFHPAIWWVLEQEQLAREQTIDALVVSRTSARRAYMQALVTFADMGAGVAPALSFARRRHLALRLNQLAQESTMSRIRLVSTTAALVTAMLGSSWGVVSALPLDLRVPSPTPSAPEALASVRLPDVSTTLAIPDRAPLVRRAARAQTGGARVPPGPPGIVPSTQTSTAFVTTEAPTSSGPVLRTALTQVNVNYVPAAMRFDADIIVTVIVSPSGDVTSVGRYVVSLHAPLSGTGQERTSFLQTVIPPYAEAVKAAVHQWKFAVADTESTVMVAFSFTGQPQRAPDTATAGTSRPSGVGSSRPGEVVPVPAAPGRNDAPRATATVTWPRKILDVQPVYSEEAKASGVRGMVMVSFAIAPDGSVVEAQVRQCPGDLWRECRSAAAAPGTPAGKSVPPYDDQAILDAVRQWKYEPYEPRVVNGKPILLREGIGMRVPRESEGVTP